MAPTDQRTFRFQMNGRPAQAYTIGAQAIGLVLPAEGLTASAQMTIVDGRALMDALGAAIAASESTAVNELYDRTFDERARAERLQREGGQ